MRERILKLQHHLTLLFLWCEARVGLGGTELLQQTQMRDMASTDAQGDMASTDANLACDPLETKSEAWTSILGLGLVIWGLD